MYLTVPFYKDVTQFLSECAEGPFSLVLEFAILQGKRMTSPLTTFASDRSQRWILVPGVASTRQVEIRNETDSPIEVHVHVEEPSAASASPASMTIQPRHSRVADIIFLANWSPAQDRRATISLRDGQGNQLSSFSQEIVAADSSDCSLSLELKDDVLVDNAIIAMKLWCTVASRSATPRRFEIDFAPHPALQFPERKTVTLAPGESTAFEAPVQWNRAIRDVAGWNHPRVIEAFVPVSDGRRTAILSWEHVEQRLAPYLTNDDQQPKLIPAQPLDQRRASFMEKTPGQLKYEELIELKRLEQSVVSSTPGRIPVKPVDELDASARPSSRRFPIAPFVTIAFALVALVLAGFFFLRPPEKQVTNGPISVSPLKLSPAPAVHPSAKSTTRSATAAAVATQVLTSTSQVTQPNSVTSSNASAPRTSPKSVAVAPTRKPAPLPTIDRSQVVGLSGVAAEYAQGGRAVSVAWSGAAQASALVQLVDFDGKVIASRTIRGDSTAAVLRLPRGYHGSVSVDVTAFGYHGERVVQTASLSPPG